MGKRKTFTWVQTMYFIALLVLFTAGCYVINVPDNKLSGIASRLGLAMLFAGSVNIFIYSKLEKKIISSRWILADGMTTTLLSFFPLFNQMIPSVVIPFFFGVWELFSGILKFIDSTELQERRIDGWIWFLIIGTFELVSGVLSMIKPIDDFVGMNHVIAIILFVQGIGFLFKIIIYPHLIIKK